ncbi:MAG: hypothetical protein H0T53_04795, partial [Herpetosiphonaceae bacterium]|nr:hypothetical protein [Herpetosiphonaceae bacterium]
VDQAGFMVVSGNYTVSLIPDQDFVRIDTPAARDDQAAQVRLRGTVRNVTPLTGVTLTVSDNGAALPALEFPDLAPGASADFEFWTTPTTAGDHTFSVQTPTGDRATANVAVLAPSIAVGPIGGAGADVAAGSLATLTIPVSNTSPVPAFVDLAALDGALQTLNLEPESSTLVSLQVPIGPDLPVGAYSVPISFTGDLTRIVTATLFVQGAPPIIPPVEDTGGTGAATIQAIAATPQPVQCGTALELTITIQPTALGRQVLEVVGLENQVQVPLVFDTLAQLNRTVTFTVPATLPAGEYPISVRLGEHQTTYVAQVNCWAAALELQVPSAGIPHGSSFPVTVAVTETAGVAAPAVITVRYGEVAISQTLQLLPYQTILTTLPLTADIGVGRVTTILSAPETDTEDPAYQPIIDSRPVSVYLGNAFVELAPLQAPAGVTLTGELVITGPITSARLSLPESMGGGLLLSASIYSTTAVFEEGLIDLQQTPAGRWAFSVPLARDMQRGRYALDFYVNGVWQPVPFDVEGPQVIVSEIAVAEIGSCTPQLNLTLNIESATTIIVSPTVHFERIGGVVKSGPIQLYKGRQTITLPIELPTSVQGSGQLSIGFNSLAGNSVGGTTTMLQRGQSNLIAARLEGISRSAPANVVLDVFGAGMATIVLKPDRGATYTTTHQLSGYQTIRLPLTFDRAASSLSVTLLDQTGCRSVQTLLLSEYLPDLTPPTVSLNAPTPANPGTPTTVPVVFTGTAIDGDNLICSVAVNGQSAQVDAETGVYSVTLRLPPGSYQARALAKDCAGNQGESNPQNVTVRQTLPIVQFTNSAAGTIEATSPVTIMVKLDQVAAFTTTVRYYTDGGSATPNADYLPISGTLTFAPFQLSQQLAVPIIEDALNEFDETVVLQLSDPLSATLGYPHKTIVVLVDDDPEPEIGFITPTVSIVAGRTSVELTVTLSAPSGRPIWVDYATVDGTAIAGEDYTATHRPLLFPAGVTSRTFSIPLLPGAKPGRQFSVVLNNPIYTQVSAGQVTISFSEGENKQLYLPLILRDR